MVKNDIANLALAHLGVSLTVADIDLENTLQAKVIRRWLEPSLYSLLEDFPWAFAAQRAPLVLFANDPSPSFQYSYSYPADCLVIRMIAQDGCFPEWDQNEDEKDRWKEMYGGSGRKLWTNILNAHAEYTTKVSTALDFPEHFSRALAAKLAQDIGNQLITNNWAKLKTDILTDTRIIISDAKAKDLARQPRNQESPNTFLRVRGN